MDGGGRRTVDHHLLRFRWRGEDDHGRRLRPPGGAARPARLRGDHRSGPAVGQFARARHAQQPAHPYRGSLARRAPRPHARPEGDLRRSDPAILGQRPAGGGDQGQPDLPEPDRVALGHPGVHGHGEALRAGRGRGVRRGGGGHPSHPQRPGFPRRPEAPDPVSREPGVPGADEAHPGRPQVHGGGGPGPAADDLTGGRSRHRPRCGGLLPGLRGDGGGIPDPGGAGQGAAGPGGYRLHPGGVTPPGLRRRGRPLRRQAGRVGHGRHRAGGQPGPAPLRRRCRAGLADTVCVADTACVGIGRGRRRRGRPTEAPAPRSTS